MIPSGYKNKNPKSEFYNKTFPLSTTYLREIRNKDYLLKNFLTNINHLVNILNDYENSLMLRIHKLVRKRGETDKKVLILKKKTSAIRQEINNLSQLQQEFAIKNFSKNDYRSLRKKLTDQFKRSYKETIQVMQFSSSDLSVLATPRSFLQKNFIGTSSIFKAVKKATKAANDSLLNPTDENSINMKKSSSL